MTRTGKGLVDVVIEQRHGVGHVRAIKGAAIDAFSKRSANDSLVIEDGGVTLHYGGLTLVSANLKAARQESLLYIVSHVV
jgi:hypothetical protein